MDYTKVIDAKKSLKVHKKNELSLLEQLAMTHNYHKCIFTNGDEGLGIYFSFNYTLRDKTIETQLESQVASLIGKEYLGVPVYTRFKANGPASVDW